MTHRSQHELSPTRHGDLAMRDFAPLGVRDDERNRLRREAFFRNLPRVEGKLVEPCVFKIPHVERRVSDGHMAPRRMTEQGYLRGWALLLAVIGVLMLAHFCGWA